MDSLRYNSYPPNEMHFVYQSEMSSNWKPKEKVIHEKVFDTLSRPFSRATDDSGNMFSGKKVKWEHFGKKYSLRISDYEMEYADLYDAVMKKIFVIRPDFEGQLAYIDQYGRQNIITNDKDLREALSHSKNKLKIHTHIPDGTVISAAELAGRPTRSQSVPPERGYHTYPTAANSRSPSSMDSAPATYRNRAASPPPVPAKPASVAGSYAGYPPIPPVDYYKYGHPYSQSIAYGMPPYNGMLMRFLANPFPFGSYHRTFMGPNKFHQYHGGWGGRYYSSGFGPMIW